MAPATTAGMPMMAAIAPLRLISVKVRTPATTGPSSSPLRLSRSTPISRPTPSAVAIPVRWTSMIAALGLLQQAAQHPGILLVHLHALGQQVGAGLVVRGVGQRENRAGC